MRRAGWSGSSAAVATREWSLKGSCAGAADMGAKVSECERERRNVLTCVDLQKTLSLLLFQLSRIHSRRAN